MADVITSLTRDVADFPMPGIQFRDLTPLFADREALNTVIDALADVAGDADLVAGIDSRGLLVGAAIAARLGVGMLAIRKSGKLPPPVLSEDYEMEYGSGTIEIPADIAELRGRNALIVDDVLATGGTLNAASRLLERAGVSVTGVAVVMELTALGGREAIAPLQVHSLSQV